MPTSTLPSIKDVRDMLTDLLGKDVTTAPSAPVEPDKPIGIGVFVDDSTRTAAVAVADLKLAAYLGAAIGLVPPGGAEAAIEDGVLPATISDNFAEVLNILSALFNTPGAPHLRLYATYGPGEVPPTDVSALVRGHGGRLDLDVTIAGYGQGRLSFVLAF